MIPDNVEKIIMTKEDYDRNVEQLLYDKINADQEIERLNNIIKEVRKKLNFYETTEWGMNGYEALQDIRKILDKGIN